MTDKHPHLDKQSDDIRKMFAGIAHRYDILNRFLSAWVDTHWRRLTPPQWVVLFWMSAREPVTWFLGISENIRNE